MTKEADVAKMCGEAPPSKRRKTSSQGLDKCKLAQAIPMTPSTTVRFHQTGVAKNQVSEQKGANAQSIYRCNVTGCEYIMAQFAQACTHVCHKHLGVCVKCRLCDKRSFRSVDIQKHCHIVHRDEESEWFELMPALEGDIVKVTKETLEANIALVKKEINPEDDDDDNDEELP